MKHREKSGTAGGPGQGDRGGGGVAEPQPGPEYNEEPEETEEICLRSAEDRSDTGAGEVPRGGLPVLAPPADEAGEVDLTHHNLLHATFDVLGLRNS